MVVVALKHCSSSQCCALFALVALVHIEQQHVLSSMFVRRLDNTHAACCTIVMLSPLDHHPFVRLLVSVLVYQVRLFELKKAAAAAALADHAAGEAVLSGLVLDPAELAAIWNKCSKLDKDKSGYLTGGCR